MQAQRPKLQREAIASTTTPHPVVTKASHDRGHLRKISAWSRNVANRDEALLGNCPFFFGLSLGLAAIVLAGDSRLESVVDTSAVGDPSRFLHHDLLFPNALARRRILF